MIDMVGTGDAIADFVRRSLAVERPLRLTKLRGFFTAATLFRLYLTGHSYLLKVYDQADEVQERWERRNLESVGGSCLSVVASSPQIRATIFDLGPSAPLMRGRILDSAIPLLGKAIAGVHRLRVEQQTRRVYDQLYALLELRAAAYEEIASFRLVRDALLAFQPQFAESFESEVLAHNAIHARNVIVQQCEVYLINWEHGAQAPPLFDIACAMELLQLDEMQSTVLLSAYFDENRPALDERNLSWYRMASCALHALLLLPEEPIARTPLLHADAPVLDLQTCLELLDAEALDMTFAIDRWRLALALLDRASHLIKRTV